MKREWSFIIIGVVVAILEAGWLQPLFVHKYRLEWMVSILVLCLAVAYLIPEQMRLQSELDEKEKNINGNASRNLRSLLLPIAA